MNFSVEASWRAEFREVAETFRNAIMSLSDIQDNKAVHLVSDADPSSADPPQPLTIRLWWNGPSEIEKYALTHDEGRFEVHITFFRDSFEQLSERLPQFYFDYVPYVFPDVRTALIPIRPNLSYVGEVSVHLEGLTKLSTSRQSVLEDICRTIAQNCVSGRSPINLENALVEAFGDDASSFLEDSKWLVRNFVRSICVSALSKTFGNKLHLRGNDWTRLGYRSGRTIHARSIRRLSYGLTKVALDFGSKSTDDFFYPRTAEILSSGSSLVKFLPAGSISPSPPSLADCVVRNLDALKEKCEERLSMRPSELREFTRSCQVEYRLIRRQVLSESIPKILTNAMAHFK